MVSQYGAELVKAQVDIIYAGGGVAIRAAQQATKTIPILGITDNMVQEGLVDSLVRPGRNTTGVSILATELDGKPFCALFKLSGVRLERGGPRSDIG
jgi:putative ABC transport system substrate-binding protein